mmetsp:Transcript_16387/g.14315  ORF Transcript_16387/g.14315 Transcript_16387/m.14315 type:complete len:343 (+) Transcript_16387:21-1049(+)
MEEEHKTTQITSIEADQNIDRLNYAYTKEDTDYFFASSYNRVEKVLTGQVYLVTCKEDTLSIQTLTEKYDYGIFSQSLTNEDNGDISLKLGCSDGSFRLYSFSKESLDLKQEHNICIKDDDMILNHDEGSEHYAFAMDSGNLYVYDKTTLKESYFHEKAHEYQTWCVLNDPVNSDIVYTGADDAKFKTWDLRLAGDNSTVMMLNMNRSEYGVTCIQPWLEHQDYVVTGSYDQNLNLWDKRQMKKSVETLNIGKQIWDIKYHNLGSSSSSAKIGISCVWDGMYFSDVNLDSTLTSLSSLAQYNFPNQEILYYAFDFLPTKEEEKQKVLNVAFYKNKIELIQLD